MLKYGYLKQQEKKKYYNDPLLNSEAKERTAV